jgi:hypothetical protein
MPVESHLIKCGLHPGATFLTKFYFIPAQHEKIAASGELGLKQLWVGHVFCLYFRILT